LKIAKYTDGNKYKCQSRRENTSILCVRQNCGISIAVGHLCQQSVVGGIRVAGQAAGTNLYRSELTEAVIGHDIGLSQSVHRAGHC